MKTWRKSYTNNTGGMVEPLVQSSSANTTTIDTNRKLVLIASWSELQN